MQINVDASQLVKAVDEIMTKQGYKPANQLIGHTIGIKEFARKYCYPHSINWVKENILYKYKPDWVADLHPDRGRAFTIFEYPAAQWMEEHRRDIDW